MNFFNNFNFKDLKKSTICLIIIVLVCFLVSVTSWTVHFPGIRRVYMFESSDNGKVCMEWRYLPLKPVQGRVNMYVEELLLGPETARFRPLFSMGTKAVSCFKRKGTLYVDLSDTLLTEDGEASAIKKGIRLFRMNILHNFENIHTVEVFVGGKLAYEDDLFGQKKR
jgi:hypothetical protein